jgi:hypothetical protein
MRALFILSIVACCTHFCVAQKNPQEPVQLWLSQLDSLLSLTQEQEVKLEGVFLFYELERASIELSILQLNDTLMDPSEWEIKDNALRMKRKNINKEREEKILAELNENQRTIYLNSIAPNKPQVLHMGLKHDKINCTICVKPSTP